MRGVPRRAVLWAPDTLECVRGYPKRVRRLIGRAIEVAQWGETDTHAKPLKGRLREVFEIVVVGDRVTHRCAYYATKDPEGPVAVLDAFIKKSTTGIATPAHIVSRIESRLARVKEIERE